MHAHSVRPHKRMKIYALAGYTVAYIHSLNLAVTRRSTRCIVSVPVENFIAAQPNKI